MARPIVNTNVGRISERVQAARPMQGRALGRGAMPMRRARPVNRNAGRGSVR